MVRGTKKRNRWGLGSPLFTGTWRNIRVWDSPEAWEAAKAGVLGVEPVLILPDFPNGITTVGMHYALEVCFRSDDAMPVAQEAPWYALLIDNSGYTGDAAADTYTSHSGWAESTAYSESNRPTLAFDAPASRLITAQVAFTMNATTTLRGIGVVTNNTKGHSSSGPLLFSTALFDTPPTMANGQVLTANYTLTD